MQASLHSHPSKYSRIARSRARLRSAFTLAEVALSLTIFTLMTLMFGAVLPSAVRGAQHGNNYAQAAALAQRKVDQLRVAGYSRLFDGTDGTALSKLITQNVVNGQSGASGAGGGTYDFTTVDKLTGTNGYFPPGSTGTITVAPYNAQTAGSVALVTVTLNWGGTVPGNYTVSALIVSMLHQ